MNMAEIFGIIFDVDFSAEIYQNEAVGARLSRLV